MHIQIQFCPRWLNPPPFWLHPQNSVKSEIQKIPRLDQNGVGRPILWGCGVQHSHFQRSACVAGRQQLPTHHFVSGSTTAIVEHNLNSKIWNNGYGNRNCNVQWRKVVFLGTRRSSLEAANGPRQRCGSFSATCEMEDFLIKLKYHAPFDPISVFQYKLCLNKFPKGQQKDIQCCCFVE